MSVPGFLSKTFRAFSNLKYSDCCGWGPNGDTIIIKQVYQLPPFDDLSNEADDKLQVAITRVIQACRAFKIFQSATQTMKTRLIFCAGTGSAMFQAIPKTTTPHLAFPPEGTAYLAAVCVQLGLPIRFIVAQECVGVHCWGEIREQRRLPSPEPVQEEPLPIHGAQCTA